MAGVCAKLPDQCPVCSWCLSCKALQEGDRMFSMLDFGCSEPVAPEFICIAGALGGTDSSNLMGRGVLK